MGLPLITKAEYKAYAGKSSTNDDAIIDNLIPKVSSLVKTICRRAFIDYVNDSKIEYFDGGVRYFMPSEYPILNVSSLEYSIDYGNTYTSLTEFTDYTIGNSDGSIRCIGTGFPLRINGYKLTYTAGYEVLPDDLKLAVLDLVTYYIKNDGAVHSNKTSSSSSVQIEYITTTNLPAHIKRILDQYADNYN